MTIDDIIQFVTNANNDIKILLLIALAVYLLFSFIVARQLSVFSGAVKQIMFSSFLKTLGFLNVLAALLLFIYVLLVI